jgi:hypothetical protein
VGQWREVVGVSDEIRGFRGWEDSATDLGISIPSDKDIHMRIDYIALFFNTTEDEAPGATRAFDLKCARHGWINSDALCRIPSAAEAVTLAMTEVSASRRLSFSSIAMLLMVSLTTGLLVW